MTRKTLLLRDPTILKVTRGQRLTFWIQHIIYDGAHHMTFGAGLDLSCSLKKLIIGHRPSDNRYGKESAKRKPLVQHHCGDPKRPEGRNTFIHPQSGMQIDHEAA
jgi:hypothetical protein